MDERGRHGRRNRRGAVCQTDTDIYGNRHGREQRDNYGISHRDTDTHACTFNDYKDGNVHGNIHRSDKHFHIDKDADNGHDTHVYAYACCYADIFADTNAHGCGNADTNAHGCGNADTDAHNCGHADTNAHGCGNADAYAHNCGHTNTNAHLHKDIYADKDGHCESNIYVYCHPNAYYGSYADANLCIYAYGYSDKRAGHTEGTILHVKYFGGQQHTLC